MLISHPNVQIRHLEYVLLFGDVSSFNKYSHIRLRFNEFCNVRELLNVGFEIRTQNKMPLAIISSEDIGTNTYTSL